MDHAQRALNHWPVHDRPYWIDRPTDTRRKCRRMLPPREEPDCPTAKHQPGAIASSSCLKPFLFHVSWAHSVLRQPRYRSETILLQLALDCHKKRGNRRSKGATALHFGALTLQSITAQERLTGQHRDGGVVENATAVIVSPCDPAVESPLVLQGAPPDGSHLRRQPADTSSQDSSPSAGASRASPLQEGT